MKEGDGVLEHNVVERTTVEAADVSSAQSYEIGWAEDQDCLLLLQISAADPVLLLTRIATHADGVVNQVSQLPVSPFLAYDSRTITLSPTGHHAVLLQWPLTCMNSATELFAYMHIWDVRTQQLIYGKAGRAIHASCWSPDGSFFNLIDADDHGSLMDIATLICRRIDGGTNAVEIVGCKQTGFTVCSFETTSKSWDLDWCMLDLQTQQLLRLNAVEDVSISEDGSRLAFRRSARSADSLTRICACESGRCKEICRLDPALNPVFGKVYAMAWSPGARYLCAKSIVSEGSIDGEILVLDGQSGKVLLSPAAPEMWKNL